MMKSKMSVLLVGLALSGAAPVLPAWAQDRDRDRDNPRNEQDDQKQFGQRIERDEVPEAAMRAFKQYIPAEAKQRAFHRRKINDVPVFIERFTHPDGRRLALTVRKDGSLVEPQEVALITGRPLPAAPGQVPVPAVPPVATPLPGQPQPLPPVGQPAVLTQQQARDQIAALDQQQAQIQAQSAQVDAQIAQDQKRMAPLEALVRQGDQGAATERQRTQERIQQLTAQRDQLTLQSTDINARRRALATQAGLTLPADDAREAAAREAARDAAARNPDRDRDDRIGRDDRADRTTARGALRPVQRDDVPNAVVMAVSRQADGKGGHNWQWFRANTDDYVVRYTTQDNRQWETRIDNSGQVLDPARAITAAADDRNDRNALRTVQRDDVPNAVVMAVSRQADGKGGHDWQWFRVPGSDDYVVRYTTQDQRKWETRIDNTGKVVEPARALRQ